MDTNPITYFAKTNARNKMVTFGIKKKDRTRHTYIIGKTGTGKTTLQENMAVQDIRNGEGVAVIDPHGSFAEKMLDYVPKERINDVIYFDPSDMDNPIALNIMEDVDGEQRHLVASGLMGVFKKMWPDVWSARMEYILNNTILALLEYPDSTLLGINRMFSDKDYREMVVANITDPIVKSYWTEEYAGYTERFAAEATPAIQNKVGQFTSNPLIRNIIGQPKSSFDFRKAMDEKKIVIINLSKGRIGDLNSNLLGAMIVTKIYLASMSRAKEPEKEFPDFYLYVDEFQNFAAESFENILSESRKYGLGLVLAHQYIAQMPEVVRDAVFGNVGTHVVFRVGPADAQVLEIEFSPEFTADDIVNLGFASIYLKLLIDGEPSRPFSGITLPPIQKNEISYKQEVIEASRKNYCTPKEDVEGAISEWHQPIKKPKAKDGEEKKEEPKTPEAPKLFEANCSVCGKKTVVPFEPDPSKPIYCKKHRFYATEMDSAPKSKPSERKGSVPAQRERMREKNISDKPDFPKSKTSRIIDKPSLTRSAVNKREFLSLGDLEKKPAASEAPSFAGAKKPKSTPDFKGLRELLSDISPEKFQEKKDDNNNNKEDVVSRKPVFDQPRDENKKSFGLSEPNNNTSENNKQDKGFKKGESIRF